MSLRPNLYMKIINFVFEEIVIYVDKKSVMNFRKLLTLNYLNT